ncbi:MAG TPA: sigma 54-interacting transcriptional regulator [Polyangia bacterium]|nr:sigma 54-interacting transcriptional regulator [Polyangia bacterium]
METATRRLTGQLCRLVARDGADVRLMQTCTVEILSGRDVGKVARIDKPLYRIGAHESNDLVLADDAVSKHHLEVGVGSDGYRVVDLSSSNGTFMGAVRVADVTICEPVTLQLGTTSIRIVPAAAEAEVPASTRSSFGSVLGRSVVMRELFEQLDAVAKSDCSVLIEGDTGVGKEQVAESIHNESQRREAPFVVVDCGAILGDLMESELFGHAKGAFTGAESERRGLLQQADGGSIFLDEVGELPLPLQAKLLGVLERRRVTPLGESTSRPVDVRVLAATHRNLAREVNEGRFRADLFFRLAVVRLHVPALRERLDDIPMLVEAFLGDLRQREGEHIPQQLSPVELARLSAQPWAGNVRELRNAVERAALKLGRNPSDADAASDRPEPFIASRDRFVDAFEQRYLTDILERCDANVSEAARQAGVDRRNFQRLLRRHHIIPRELKRK